MPITLRRIVPPDLQGSARIDQEADDLRAGILGLGLAWWTATRSGSHGLEPELAESPAQLQAIHADGLELG
jgi:hypothetical protein